MNLPETAKLQEIYGETEISGARFKNLADNYSKIYGQDRGSLSEWNTGDPYHK